jgi:hypothetical protein
MDKATRNAIERATQQARKLLEEDFSSQLEGTFDVLRSGVIASIGGVHLSAVQQSQRGKIVAAVEHKRAAGMTAAQAVTDYVRDTAFTTLNRFIAFKMLEARELVQECITKGEQSAGYREFCGMAPGVALLPDAAGYRLYIESLFDEFSTEIKVLFDRRDAASVLWPKRQTFDALLAILNAQELSAIWGEDETIGWVYQFFNSKEERQAMRDPSQGGSQVPRDSRELAVRNQFFTPRYVVQFLADNTLGRLWVEMRGERTRLNTICEYLVRSADEAVPSRPPKDPRDLRILDPACGSGHFLLYSFDLLLTIYEESWSADGSPPRSEATGRTLRDDYHDLVDLRRAVPHLILEHNLYGIDIDPRCAQIAALALWLRSQRAWKDLAVAASERPRVHRTHIVVAEPMPGDAALVDEFAARLNPPLLRDLFKKMVDESRLAGELGPLLRVEDAIAVELHRAREQFVKQRQTTDFLPGLEPVKKGVLDLSGIDDDRFFHEAEGRIVEALRGFAETAIGGASVRRQLFAGDAAQGIALIDLVRTRFDVILMNPPFGEASPRSAPIIGQCYPDWNKNLLCAFVGRSSELLNTEGLCGSVVDRTINEKSTYEAFRLRYFLNDDISIRNVADLGWGVLDANVEVSALVIGRPNADGRLWGLDAREVEKKAEILRSGASGRWVDRTSLRRLPNSVIGYFFPDFAIRLFATYPSLRDASFDFFEGHTLKSARYFRLAWECSVDSAGSRWQRLFNGTAYSRFAYPHHDMVLLGDGACALADESAVIRNLAKHQKSGVCFGKRGEFIDAQMLPPGFVSTVEGKVCLAPSTEDAWALLALLNSRLFQAVINLYTGQHKYSGYVEQFPYPGTAKLVEAAQLARAIVKEKWRIFARVEISPNFEGLDGLDPASLVQEAQAATERIDGLEKKINLAVLDAYGCREDEAAGTFIENACKLEPNTRFPFQSDDPAKTAAQIVQYEIGKLFQRWDRAQTSSWSAEALFLSDWGNQAIGRAVGRDAPGILVVDDGHPADISRRLEDALPSAELASIVDALKQPLRTYMRFAAFADHLDYYSSSGRRAPVYWQLATPSSSYSTWIYYHAFSSDTFYKLQNDFVAPKIAHEERRLELLRSEFGPNANATERKQLAGQESYVDELRAFLNNVKLVAPLWNPKIDDGVIINFAPLWRLVEHQKPWQKELKAEWDALCAGEYDWTQLAMRLWPERVVPKCASDRSLAIAHGLQDVFWVEEDNEKWKSRPVPTRSIDELVHERTSNAIKAALKSLLEVPAANANGGRVRGRRIANAVADGGSR